MGVSEQALGRLTQAYAKRWYREDASNWTLIRATPGYGTSHRTHWMLVRFEGNVPQWDTEQVLGRTTEAACRWIWEHRNEEP